MRKLMLSLAGFRSAFGVMSAYRDVTTVVTGPMGVPDKVIVDVLKIPIDTSFEDIAYWRKLVQCAVVVDSSGGVTSSFSLITPNSTVFQVIIGGGGGGGFLGGGAAAPARGTTPTVEAPAAKEKKKEEKVKESDDEDTGFSLFD
ncbi:Uncharacterized protein TCM_009860 [Theobroma cacao]|uniref:60S acidic ribosomal protein family n=1 Tax=Theobroma cacao TaxID=3641 RepID=A0A061ED56_THECC|nr:Uncharacterized protein TCM_009860 [Theobroma cacao]